MTPRATDCPAHQPDAQAREPAARGNELVSGVESDDVPLAYRTIMIATTTRIAAAIPAITTQIGSAPADFFAVSQLPLLVVYAPLLVG